MKNTNPIIGKMCPSISLGKCSTILRQDCRSCGRDEHLCPPVEVHSEHNPWFIHSFVELKVYWVHHVPSWCFLHPSLFLKQNWHALKSSQHGDHQAIPLIISSWVVAIHNGSFHQCPSSESPDQLCIDPLLKYKICHQIVLVKHYLSQIMFV